MRRDKPRDIFEIFTSLEQMLEQQQQSQLQTPDPSPVPEPQPRQESRTPQLTSKPAAIPPHLQFNRTREFASPHMVRLAQKKARANSRSSPRRRRSPAERRTLQLFFLKWIQRCAAQMSHPEAHKVPRVSFDLAAPPRTTDDEFNLEETSPLPGTITPGVLSSSEVLEPTSFDIHDTPEPSPRGETKVKDFSTASLKQKQRK